MIEDYFGMYQYWEYRHLSRFKRTAPKRCAQMTPHGFLCEYYTMPRTFTDKKPAKYTPYTKYQIYDVNNDGKLVRVSIRVPKYIDDSGQIYEEPFSMYPGKYTHEALNKMHAEFCNPCIGFDLFKKHFPLNKNATKDAYETLYPWARKNHVFPEYPDDFSYLWFVDVPYKDTILTFCLACSLNEEPSLFDILVNNNFDSLDEFLRYDSDMPSPLYICCGANRNLYEKLHIIFPNGTFVFDPFQIITIMEQCLQTNYVYDKPALRLLRRKVLDSIKHICLGPHPYEDAINFCQKAIHELPSYLNTEFMLLTMFQENIAFILSKEKDFISEYIHILEFHTLLPYQLKEAIKDYYKCRGYEPDRFAYMLLSKIKDLPYVDPYTVFALESPDMLTDDELEEMEDEAYHIMSNAQLSSVINLIESISNGTYKTI